MRILLLSFLFSSNIISLNAQDTVIVRPQDPLLNYSKFSETSLTINITRVNTQHVEFHTPDNHYKFRQNNYVPTSDVTFLFGWLFRNRSSDIMILKTGMQLTNREANLIDINNQELRLSTNYFQIPLMLGFRTPILNNKAGAERFRAVELYFGLYGAIPTTQRLRLKNDVDATDRTRHSKYVRTGLISEMSFSSFNKSGRGAKFGIRSSSDFSAILHLGNNRNPLLPYYRNFGIFYNVINRYK